MGYEHTPTPKPFEKFPPFSVSFLSATVVGNILQIQAKTSINPYDQPERYRLYVRLSLSAPGTGYSVRGMRGFLAEAENSDIVTITIPAYKEIWPLELQEYQIHSLCVLLDAETGYRSQAQRHSGIIAFS